MKWIVKPGIVVHQKIAWLLLFSAVTLAGVGWIIFTSERNIERTNLRIGQTYEIVATCQNMIIAVSGDTGGGVTGKGQQAGGTAVQRVLEQYLDSLRVLSRENNDQQQHIFRLQNLIDRMPADGQAGIRELLYLMVREENGLLASRKSQNKAAIRKTALGLVIGRAASFLFVVIVLIQVNSDITRRKKTQEQLARAVAEAESAKQMQEQFLANMSHEIRTPMNGIKGMTDLLMGTDLTEKQQELTGIIKSSVNNLLVVINDILDFSKIKAGKLTIEKIDFSLKEALKNARALFEHRLKKKGLTLSVEIDPAIPDLLSGDPHRLSQVLINLVGNAIKFTDQGEIRIGVSLMERQEDQVVLAFTISDSGIGIAPESLPIIFDSFSQAGQDISRRYGGTGLGLTISKQLLQLQGGDISVSSTVGKGSTFRFHLPYEIGNIKGVSGVTTEANTDYSNLLTGKSFLVAEDNEINQKLIDYVLRKAGGDVELVNNGAEAIRVLQDGKLVDLIIMDLQMPEMDGYMTTRYIRNDLHMQTPIIAMTATAMKGEQLQCIESGMNEYMTKPFEFADLYKKINNLLS
ncbi:MAG: ATP-binding protein [Bacteroidota bacterium]|nr:ATP-binding protein [Bacteroidota bacterium]MDP4215020.1 ATP-binding protein [Bacteroidota bacterium]MDP4255953.1 ATP-binding protein [Bacteroidota bacterium]MDP4258892.1 ATP-binding protein [Bacteroidota bacterium]